jgi:hypothetical protein
MGRPKLDDSDAVEAVLSDGSKNRWHLGLIADSVSLGARGIGDGRATWIF